MLEQVEKLDSKKKIESFFSKIVKYSKDIAEIIGVQAKDKINTFIKKSDKNEIKQAILSISSSLFKASFYTGQTLVSANIISYLFHIV